MTVTKENIMKTYSIIKALEDKHSDLKIKANHTSEKMDHVSDMLVVLRQEYNQLKETSKNKENVMELHPTIKVVELDLENTKKLMNDVLDQIAEIGDMLQVLYQVYNRLKEKVSGKVFQINFQLHGNQWVSGFNKDDAVKKEKEILTRALSKLEDLLKLGKLTFELTDILGNGSKYNDKLDEFEVNFVINGIAFIPAENEEEAENEVNDKINKVLECAESNIFGCGLSDEDGYIQNIIVIS